MEEQIKTTEEIKEEKDGDLHSTRLGTLYKFLKMRVNEKGKIIQKEMIPVMLAHMDKYVSKYAYEAADFAEEDGMKTVQKKHFEKAMEKNGVEL